MKAPVTVIIPAYNAEKTIEKAIQSIFSQTCQVEKIIVIDDGSTDNTLNIVKSLSENARNQKDFPQLDVIAIQNSGVSHARNIGIKASATMYTAFLDSDDAWHKEKIEKQMKAFENYPDATLVSTSSTVKKHFSNKTKIISFTHLLMRNHVITSSAISKTETLKLFLFDEELKRAEDYNLWLKLATKGQLIFIDEELVFFADKRTFGQSGLSKDFHALSRDELRGFIKLKKSHTINVFQFLFAFSMSCIKYLRKCIIVYLSKK